MEKIVITGPPFAGKSLVIKELGNQGYNTVDESAREILNSLRNLNFIDPHKNKRDYFQREVVLRQIKIEDENRNIPLTFYDRGIVDSIAYYEGNLHILDVNKTPWERGIPKTFINIFRGRIK